jgi:heterodisulfide reductase subunit A
VAACTPRTHEAVFQETLVQAGLNKYLFEMANIRNHCSWVHSRSPEAATEKAKDLVRMAVAKASLLRLLSENEMPVVQEALVIGGGIAGLTAAKVLADQGFKTHLVEKSSLLGGQARNIWQTWKGEDVQENIASLIQEVRSNDKINVYLDAEIKSVEGVVGQFKTTISASGQEHVVEHGAAIIATGASELKPEGYLYGQDSRVLTGLELDRRLMDSDEELKKARSAVFIQCVGSRVPERPYCSKVCCTHSIVNALKLKELRPDMEVYIVHRDIRTYGLREELYRRARDNGIRFVRYVHEEGLTVAKNAQNLSVQFLDFVFQRKMELHGDLVVLASAIVPPKENPMTQLFKVPVNSDGFFLEAHVKLRPVDFATDGVYVCGLAHAPKSLDESIAQAQAAAARAVTVLNQSALHVGGIVSYIDSNLCTGCQVCIAVCPYQAISLNEKGKAVVNEVLCKGCGNCDAACRSGAPSLKGFTNEAIFAQIDVC